MAFARVSRRLGTQTRVRKIILNFAGQLSRERVASQAGVENKTFTFCRRRQNGFK
jgi:hypothetical protein